MDTVTLNTKLFEGSAGFEPTIKLLVELQNTDTARLQELLKDPLKESDSILGPLTDLEKKLYIVMDSLGNEIKDFLEKNQPTDEEAECGSCGCTEGSCKVEEIRPKVERYREIKDIFWNEIKSRFSENEDFQNKNGIGVRTHENDYVAIAFDDPEATLRSQMFPGLAEIFGGTGVGIKIMRIKL